jgi:hypothetical protein
VSLAEPAPPEALYTAEDLFAEWHPDDPAQRRGHARFPDVRRRP